MNPRPRCHEACTLSLCYKRCTDINRKTVSTNEILSLKFLLLSQQITLPTHDTTVCIFTASKKLDSPDRMQLVLACVVASACSHRPGRWGCCRCRCPSRTSAPASSTSASTRSSRGRTWKTGEWCFISWRVAALVTEIAWFARKKLRRCFF